MKLLIEKIKGMFSKKVEENKNIGEIKNAVIRFVHMKHWNIEATISNIEVVEGETSFVINITTKETRRMIGKNGENVRLLSKYIKTEIEKPIRINILETV